MNTCCIHKAFPQCGCTHVPSSFPFEMHGKSSRDRNKAFHLCGSARDALGSPWWWHDRGSEGRSMASHPCVCVCGVRGGCS